MIMTIEGYKKNNGLKVISHAIDSMVLAVNRSGYPLIWVKPFRWSVEKSEPNGWIVTNERNGRSYMFKKDGLFGYTGDPADRKNNSFATIKEAQECFNKFYG